MCGIFALLNNETEFDKNFIIEQFRKGERRGPEFSKLENLMIKAQFGFHRLAINGLNSESNQPLIIEEIGLICNGEIYNYKELYKMMGVTPHTESDCEVIIHLYKRYGIEQTLQILDGVFAFVLIDYRLTNMDSKVIVARDPYGVRPLYLLKKTNNQSTFYIKKKGKSNFLNSFEPAESNIFGFASEAKMLSEFKNKMNKNIQEKKESKGNLFEKQLELIMNDRPFELEENMYTVEHFKPGTYSVYELKYRVSAAWELDQESIVYHKIGFSKMPVENYVQLENISLDYTTIYRNIQHYLFNAVEKRCSTTERPIACLLSGGLDSSLIAALVNEYHVKYDLPTIETYSIGLDGSEDLKYARMVADYLGTKHTELVLTEKDFLDVIPHVIHDIESYDTTTVRASIGNWLLGKYISENSDAKVIFNGDGSDELLGGYLYMNYAPDCIEFDKECRRLLKDIHAYDVLRSDKCISSHGLEPRTPFLDRSWVQYYMSIPLDIRYSTNKDNIEKYLLRKAYSEEYYTNLYSKPLLPKEVLWRRKEAFSDGVSNQTRSLYEIIQQYTTNQIINDIVESISDEEKEDIITANNENSYKIDIDDMCIKTNAMSSVGNHLRPKTAEQFFYRKIFEKFYPGLGHLVPYFWMPKYVEANDASARTLSIYNEKLNVENLSNE